MISSMEFERTGHMGSKSFLAAQNVGIQQQLLEDMILAFLLNVSPYIAKHVRKLWMLILTEIKYSREIVNNLECWRIPVNCSAISNALTARQRIMTSNLGEKHPKLKEAIGPVQNAVVK